VIMDMNSAVLQMCAFRLPMVQGSRDPGNFG
jgi:hypothetical protein